MEKYLIIVLLSVPGFIAKRVARCLGDEPSKRGEFESALIYFAYSLASLTLTLCAAWLFEMFSALESWSILEEKLTYPWFAARFLLLSILSSVITGAVWCMWLEKFVLKFFNLINKTRNVNERYLDGSLLNNLFDDGHDHLVCVKKNDQQIAYGFVCAVSSATTERVEMLVEIGQEMKEKIDRLRLNPNHPINTIKGTYLDVTNSVVVKEYIWDISMVTSSEVVEVAVGTVEQPEPVV